MLLDSIGLSLAGDDGDSNRIFVAVLGSEMVAFERADVDDRVVTRLEKFDGGIDCMLFERSAKYPVAVPIDACGAQILGCPGDQLWHGRQAG